VSALRFSWALIEQRTRNNPLCATGLVRLLHSALSWLAVLGLDGSASSCSLDLGAWSPTKSAVPSNLLFAKASVLLECACTSQNAPLCNSQRPAQCEVRNRKRQLGASPNPHSADGTA